MSLWGLGAEPGPFHEENERRPRRRFVRRLFRHQLDAIGEPVTPFERRRPVVHRGVASDRGLVALGVIRRAEPRVAHYDFRRWNISRTTLPVMNATLAGRSARRRMRYGYHCVPNGTYTRMRYPSRTRRSCRSRRTPYSI